MMLEVLRLSKEKALKPIGQMEDEITGGSEYVSMVPVRDGYAWWDVPWKYKVGDGAYKQICTARQDYRLTGNSTNATFRITKEASGAEITTGEVNAHFINP